MGFFPLREASPLGSLPLDPRQIKEQTIILSDLNLENKLAFVKERSITDLFLSLLYLITSMKMSFAPLALILQSHANKEQITLKRLIKSINQ